MDTCSTPGIIIKPISPENSINWNQYLVNKPESNFYQRYEWKNINEEAFGHKCFYLTAEKDQKIIGVFPIVYIKSKLFGKILSSMPFVNFGSLCTDSPIATDLLLEEAKQLVKKSDADYLEIRSLTSVSDSLPSSLNKVSMTINLDKDPDVIWNGFKTKHRTNIRRVYKDNITVKFGREELLDTFYDILSQSWKSLGTPIYKKSYFKKIIDSFNEDIIIFVAYQDGIPIATAFNGYHNNTVEGMWAGTVPGIRKVQPNYVLYWEMIKHACENGYEHFHLGRSTAGSGAEVFKKKWNAYTKQLYWQYILNHDNEIPQINVDNPKFLLAIKAWRKLPLKVTTMLGPLLAKNIP